MGIGPLPVAIGPSWVLCFECLCVLGREVRALHQARIDLARLPGFTLPTWDEVQRTADEYEPRTDDRLVIDSTRPLEETVRQALDYLELHAR